ncbi:helix-turn-helix domain-containing protein [Sphaerisporangium sp. NPDC051017]|uniref:helix-turn-helix domain-containing protein n=1 Tax=Sphaerisporangium sp. NPDC051017 TaxID=3154636 RepID=UPI00343F6A9B
MNHDPLHVPAENRPAPDSVRLYPAATANLAAEPLLLTVEEAAQRLRIGRTRMYHLVTTGAVEAVFIGRLRRVPVECLQQYVKSLLVNGGQREKTVA